MCVCVCVYIYILSHQQINTYVIVTTSLKQDNNTTVAYYN